MDPHLSSKTKCIRTSIPGVTRTTLATHTVASSTRNEKTYAEREGTATKVIGPAAGLMTDRPTLPPIPFSLQVMREDHDGLEFLPSLYAELLSQVAVPYTIVTQRLQKICREIAKLTN